MRLLIDECVDDSLRLLFPNHDCQTVRFAKLAGFEVLVTVDQNIPDQKNLIGRGISILILGGHSNRLRDLEPLVPAALMALESIGRSKVVRIG